MWPADDTLLAGMAMGDAGAAAAFVRRYQRRVYGLARTMVGDATLAEDVAQEAFLRAWRHAAAYDARRGSAITWLLAITRNLAIDTLRMHRPEPADPDAMLGLQLAAPERSPDEGAAASDEAARLRAAIDELPDEQRRAILLAAFLGHTAREVSQVESIPLGTAKTRIRTALLKLRAALAPEDAG